MKFSDRQQESIATHDEAIGLWEQAFDEPTNLYAAMHFNRANAYLRLGQEGVAFEAQEKTSRILESVTDPDVRYLRSLYSSMATANTRYGFYDKAENFINKSVR
ncbi:MAG: tetratricopeptide repeat protein, partial [Bacteroidota bacterium]